MTKIMVTKKGFTLIELMVVITIIAILASIGFVSYQIVLKNTRDAKRQTDLRVIQTGLEQYFADQLYYPEEDADTTCTNGLLTFNTSTQCALKDSGATKTYINSVPINPTTSSTTLQYCYKPLTATQDCDILAIADCDNTSSNNALRCTKYCLYSKMENPVAGGPNYPVGTVAGCTSAGTAATTANAYNYKLTPP